MENVQLISSGHVRDAVQRRLWDTVIGWLKDHRLSEEDMVWAIEQACDSDDRIANPNVGPSVVSHCPDHQLDSVLTTLVKRRMWRAVGEVLKRGVSDSTRQWALSEAWQLADDVSIATCVLPHCTDEQLDSVLTPLVERRLWRAVHEVLKRGVSETKLRWTVSEACQHATDFDTAMFILPHCPDDQQDLVLTASVERRLWWTVGDVLKRGVNDFTRKWAVSEAWQYVEDFVFDFNHPIVLEHIYPVNIIETHMLPYCADDQLDSLLTLMVERRVWRAVDKVLKRGVSDSTRQWALSEACQHADDPDTVSFILPHFADHELDSVLTTFVERRLWKSVDALLKRGVSDSTRQWALSEAWQLADDVSIATCVLPHCPDEQLDSVLTPLVERRLWMAVHEVLKRGVSETKLQWVVSEACQHAHEKDIEECIRPFCSDDLFYSEMSTLAARCFWSIFVPLLQRIVHVTLYSWAVGHDKTEHDDEVFWNLTKCCCDNLKLLPVSKWRTIQSSKLGGTLEWDTLLCTVLYEATLELLKDTMLHGLGEDTDNEASLAAARVQDFIDKMHGELLDHLDTAQNISRSLVALTKKLCELHEYNAVTSPSCVFPFIKHVIQHCYRRTWEANYTDAILMIVTCMPLFPGLQSVALRVLLRHKRFDLICHARLSRVWEQDRRRLFHAAVKQRQWSAVKQWADHTLYDDQRAWALQEAFQDQQWDLFLRLTDYGLTEGERIIGQCRVARYADWELVCRMFQTVADLRDIRELLTNISTRKKRSQSEMESHLQRVIDVIKLETDLMKKTKALKTVKSAVEQGEWRVVMYIVRHRPDLRQTRCALKAAVASEAWHVVMQLVRLETDVTRRDSLFRRMVRRRQWGVCRVLLEQDVSQQLCLKTLPKLIEQHQWTLVAMVIENSDADDVRRQVMQQAMKVREGSVVWQCISKLQSSLTVDEREALFQHAFNLEIWQAVKPLIEEKDSTGIRHRDTALLEAIEQHQWDVVDHCQRHRADINMLDDNGDTPIHRDARDEDWEAVDELTVRDGDPSLLDSKGLSVLHRAICEQQWDTVKLLITYQGDIHSYGRHDLTRHTPLQMLIDARQGALIDHTLMWCPDQGKGVNERGETTLHAVCLSGKLNTLYYLVARGADPLAVTKRGHSALFYAVMNTHCAQQMVAECIVLGFSTHQPDITETRLKKLTKSTSYSQEIPLVSPLLLSVFLGLPVVTQMLYESGSCSYTELFSLCEHLSELLDHGTEIGRDFDRNMKRQIMYVHKLNGLWSPFPYDIDKTLVQSSVDYLKEVARSPRSLQSTCRLVISRCLTLSKHRHRHVAKLPLPEFAKKYLKFSDFT